ncbi:9390_t:CDS:2 [Funneliformis geosporum]|uniref:4686_t:CDS:1 n=1 Tax=Funneliformis geosporum TaxID=1117311 RepID=A0A9W4WXN0_9GLOM|nr:9390_t:CDS:2 [Funneliformis geosporum]CAI2186796.1 4686_t:CDS:2 [Funneliformis geosporum]
MSNPLIFFRQKIQEKNVKKLAKKSPTALPIVLQNPQTAKIVLQSIKNDNEMPALLFDWNNLGFNGNLANPNCRNGVAGQTQAAIAANLVANGALDYENHGILFVFRSDAAIGVWTRNVKANIPWAKCQTGVPDVCNAIIRINRVSPDTGKVHLEDFLVVFE